MEDVPKQRTRHAWEELKEDYGDTLNSIEANFQSIGLLSVRTTAMYSNKMVVGKKHQYKCSHQGCDFLARVTLESAPNKEPFVETALKNLFKPKMIRQEIGKTSSFVVDNTILPAKTSRPS